MTMPHDEARLMAARREFKVQVPMRLKLRLHRMRLLTGRPISTMLEEALDAYLEEHYPGDVPVDP